MTPSKRPEPTAEGLLAALATARLPADNGTEEAVLSCAMQSPVWITKHAPSIPIGAFHSESNRYIWAAITALVIEGTPPDLWTVQLRLKGDGKLEAAGGVGRMTEIATLVMGASNADYYLRPLLDMHLQRQHILAHAKSLDVLLRANVSEEASLLDAIEAAKDAVDSAGTTSGRKLPRLSIAEAMDTTLDEIMARAAAGGALAGWPTGFLTLDARLGGLQKGRVSIFAGLPSDGKSSIMQNVAMAALDHGARVGWYSLEMPIPEQTLRILSEKSGVDNTDLYKGLLSRQQQDDLQRAVRRLRECGGAIVDTEDANGAEILADVENSDFDMVVIDYLQLLEPDELRKGASREEIISGLSRKMKAVARRTGKHILSASQLNDQGKLRESRAIGQNADNVFLVNKCPTEREEGRATDYDDSLEFDDSRRLLWCDKNRGGKRHWELPMWFFGHTFTFKEIQTP